MIRKNHFMIMFAVLVFAKAVCMSVVFSEEKIIKLEELKPALDASISKNERMAKEITNLEKVNSNLRSSLMAANAEAVDFRKSYSQMRLQLEAYGIESVTDGQTGIEARLIKAMNDIRILEEEKMGLSEALINLSDGSLKFIKLAEEDTLDTEVIDETRGLVDEADKALGIGNLVVTDKNTKGTIHEAGL